MNLLALALVIFASSWTHVPRDEAWHVDDSTMKTVRTELKPAVRKAAKSIREPLRRWSTYRFQFQGRLIDGRRVVFVNAYCWLDPEMSEEIFFTLSDGGTCFFDTTYDVDTKTFGPMGFHGHG